MLGPIIFCSLLLYGSISLVYFLKHMFAQWCRFNYKSGAVVLNLFFEIISTSQSRAREQFNNLIIPLEESMPWFKQADYYRLDSSVEHDFDPLHKLDVSIVSKLEMSREPSDRQTDSWRGRRVGL